MTRRSKVAAVIYGVSLALTCIGCFFWPDELGMPLPIAAVFGPFLALRMGLGSAFAALVLSLCLMTPFIFKQRMVTIGLLLLGLGVWLGVGYIAGTFLYA